MSDRISLDDNMLDDVVGGTLKCSVTSSGGTLYQYNDDHDVIGKWTVKSGHEIDVYKAMQSTYWTFEAGKRDEQCLAYFSSNGWI